MRRVRSTARGNPPRRVSGGGGGPVTRAAPVGFGLTVPFTITYNGGTSFSHNYNIVAAKPAYTNTIYVGAGGVDTNSGLTYPLRVRSLKQAIVKANALGGTVRILADPGTYKYSDVVSSIQASWAGQNLSCNLVIESSTPGQKIISVCDQLMPAFVATATDPTVYVSTYTTETPTTAAWDNANVDANGRPKALRRAFPVDNTEVNVVAAINARATQYGQGAFYQDTTNKKYYVKLIGSRAPDTSLVISSSGGTANFWLNSAATARQVWAQDCEFYGCSSSFRVTGGTGIGHQIWLKDCAALDTGAGHGFNFAGGPNVVFAVNCLAQDIAQDGYNYNGGAGAGQGTTFYELGCTSRNCGWASADGTDGSYNGSSCHVFSQGVRIGGTYTLTKDRAIHDIQDSQTWNLGLTVGPGRVAGNSYGTFCGNFATGLTATPGTSKMWLDACTSTGNDYNLEAYAGGTLYAAANCSLGAGSNDAPDGTISTYTP